MKKNILLFVLTLATLVSFAQKESRDAAILKLMNVKRGMASVNALPDNMAKNMDNQKAASFKAEMAVFKEELIKAALSKFKADYTAKEIDFIYAECTSDKIDYTDLTNGFFRKWRHLKSKMYFSKSKQTYFKYQ